MASPVRKLPYPDDEDSMSNLSSETSGALTVLNETEFKISKASHNSLKIDDKLTEVREIQDVQTLTMQEQQQTLNTQGSDLITMKKNSRPFRKV